MTKYPFEAPFDEILRNAEGYVDAVFLCLESEFLVMPKGVGFVEYPAFERGYEVLKTATKGFAEFVPTKVLPAALAVPISIVVLRTMLGFTPPEWGYVTTQRTGVNVTQGFGVRREDMKKMLLATRGKVFTLKTLDRLIEHTRLKGFKTK